MYQENITEIKSKRYYLLVTCRPVDQSPHVIQILCVAVGRVRRLLLSSPSIPSSPHSPQSVSAVTHISPPVNPHLHLHYTTSDKCNLDARYCDKYYGKQRFENPKTSRQDIISRESREIPTLVPLRSAQLHLFCSTIPQCNAVGNESPGFAVYGLSLQWKYILTFKGCKKLEWWMDY